MRVTYIAKRGLISNHVVGTTYSIDIKIKKYQPTDKVEGNQVTTISKAVTIINGIILSHKFSTIPIALTEYLLIREFLLSAMDGQLITFDVYGSVAAPVNAISGKLKFNKNIKPGQPSHKLFNYDFEILELT